MNKNMAHLVKITMANLPKGKLNLTQEEVISAMIEAVNKENAMAMQLLSDPGKLSEFSLIISGMAFDNATR